MLFETVEEQLAVEIVAELGTEGCREGRMRTAFRELQSRIRRPCMELTEWRVDSTEAFARHLVGVYAASMRKVRAVVVQEEGLDDGGQSVSVWI